MSEIRDIRTIAVPSHMIGYLFNGDQDGYSVDEMSTLDRYIVEELGTDFVTAVDIRSDEYFSWAFDIHGGTTKGGTLVDVEFLVYGD